MIAANGGSNDGGCNPPPYPMPVDWIFGHEMVTFSNYIRDEGPLVHRTTDHPDDRRHRHARRPGRRAHRPVTATLLLVVATAVHAGFQVTVTALVYPALVRTGAGDWTTVHGGLAADHPAGGRGLRPARRGGRGLRGGRTRGAATWVALAASAVALLTTATSAAPLHGRLAASPDPRLLARLLRVDRVRGRRGPRRPRRRDARRLAVTGRDRLPSRAGPSGLQDGRHHVR